MPNTFLTPSIIANEALMVLQNNLVMADLVHRDYSDEFQRVGDTITVRKPATFTARNFTGEVTAQDVTEGSATVKLDHFRDVSVKVTSKEMTLDIRNFSEQIIAPAMSALAQAVDSDLIAEGIFGAGTSVTATASPTDLKDIAQLGKAFDAAAVPQQLRRLVLGVDHKYNYVTVDNLSKVAYAGDNAALRDATIGKVYSFDTFLSQNCPNTAAATAGTATAAKLTATAGEAEVALSGLSAATATIKAGDGFIIDGRCYRFIADGTGASSAIESIAIDQPFHRTISTAETIYLVRAAHSLAFHRNGIALVTRPLELPAGAGKAAIASANGLGVRVVYDYNATTKTDMVSFDILYGVKVLDRKMVARLVG